MSTREGDEKYEGDHDATAVHVSDDGEERVTSDAASSANASAASTLATSTSSPSTLANSSNSGPPSAHATEASNPASSSASSPTKAPAQAYEKTTGNEANVTCGKHAVMWTLIGLLIAAVIAVSVGICSLDSTKCGKPSSPIPTLGPSQASTPAPAPAPFPTLRSTLAPTPFSNQEPVDCNAFVSGMMLYSGFPSVAIAFTVNVPGTNTNVEFSPEEIDAQGSMKVWIEYDGEGWIGFGPGENMVGSQPVICLPGNEADVSKYSISAQGVEGIQLMPENSQTLIGASVSQKRGLRTICEFTKLLVEDGETSINPGAPNSFVWAVGSTNALSKHLLKGQVKIPLEACTPEFGGAGIVEPVVEDGR